MSNDNECARCGGYSGGATLCAKCERASLAKPKKPKKVKAPKPKKAGATRSSYIVYFALGEYGNEYVRESSSVLNLSTRWTFDKTLALKLTKKKAEALLVKLPDLQMDKV